MSKRGWHRVEEHEFGYSLNFQCGSCKGYIYWNTVKEQLKAGYVFSRAGVSGDIFCAGCTYDLGFDVV